MYRNQEKLRVESLQGLLDHMDGPNDVSDDFAKNSGDSSSKSAQASGDVLEPALKKLRGPSPCTYTGEYSIPCPKVQVGVPIILPATFGGSPRALHQSYLDAMAIVARFGKPDYFITMTANPNWAEIQKNLRPGESAANRPDLVARVFQSKLKMLLSDLTKGTYLGRAVAHTWVVEFQKRGLPHAHILLIVADEFKPTTASDADRVVSAEIPNPDLQPELFDLVNTHMVHGPCGVLKPSCPCMKDGLCTKQYPKRAATPQRLISMDTLRIAGARERQRVLSKMAF